jgi:SRSO17 transposase
VTRDESRTDCATGIDPEVLGETFDELAGLLAPVFACRDLRSNAMAYVRGLLDPGVEGNCRQLAEAVGHARPYRLQRLLGRSLWDEDVARDAVRAFTATHLGEGGTMIFDETGQLKKGT